MINTRRKIGIGNDANSITIVGLDVQVDTHHGPNGPGVAVKVSKYTLTDVLYDLLDDYSAEHLINKINEINQ